ncbi:hypothetical protein [Streptomyces sp. GSL17-111]|uniref:hypothetical protein n=1 Tax=Streptomyces sp. GSL17-111 TaxID=3121596 RepID=UPI0030F48AC1
MTDTVRLPGGDWRLWRQFSLRGAGFPAAGVLRMAPAGVGLAADKFGARPSGIPMSGPEWAEFERFFGEAAVRTAVALQEIAALPAFRAAVGWQNRAILRSGIASFLAWTPTVDNRTSMPR